VRLSHFQTLSPICPRCRAAGHGEHPLTIGLVEHQAQNQGFVHGALHCSNTACAYEYPVVDGLPLLVPDPRQLLAERHLELCLREDLPPGVLGMLHEAAGPGSWLDTRRQNLSSAIWDHYGDTDPAERPAAGEPGADPGPTPGAVIRLLKAALEMVPGGSGPALEVGCSVGRCTLELATATRGLVLGVDLSLPALQAARRCIDSGIVTYDRRRLGLLYERRTFPLPAAADAAARVDFWAADALALPLRPGQFTLAVALNVLDCVASPVQLLRSLAAAVTPGGHFVLSCPYDWSGRVSAPDMWIGGHSPRATAGGDSGALLRLLLTPGAHAQSLPAVRIVGEARHRWHVRLHERYTAAYDVDLLAVQRLA
jgi:SAM-dependent methyltransferase/uncharacterized protein YbaR (Trm112 family)